MGARTLKMSYKAREIQTRFYGVLSGFKTNSAKQLLQQEESASLASWIISTAAGKLGRWKGKYKWPEKRGTNQKLSKYQVFQRYQMTAGQKGNYLDGGYCYYRSCHLCQIVLIVLPFCALSSCIATALAHDNRPATLTGCITRPGWRLEPAADVVVTSDPWPGVTPKGLSSVSGKSAICYHSEVTHRWGQRLWT